MAPLCTAALATTAAIFLIVYTEQYNPAGSPVAPLIVALLIAGHLPLLTDRVRPLRLPDRWRGAAPGAAVVAMVLLAGWFAWRGATEIFETPVRPAASAQLGLMTQVVSKLEAGDPIYGAMYPREGFEELNAFPSGLVIPFALARAWSLDWRFASLLGLALLVGLLAAGMIAVGRVQAAAGALLAMFLAGISWLVVPPIGAFLHWGHTMPLWPLVALVGLAAAARWPLMMALAAGFLAAMNAGWLLMAVPVAVFLFREDRARFPQLLALLLISPLLAFGAWRDHFGSMMEGILNPVFYHGAMHSKLTAWRYATIHGVGDLLNLRVAIYLCALVALGFLAREIARESSRARRLQLLALCAFVVVVCAPAAFHFHWMAHGIFLAALIPALCLEDAPVRAAAPFRGAPMLAGAAATLLLVALPASRVLVGLEDSINRRANHFQPPLENLVGGFNIPSADHAWGRDTRMEIGFTLDRVEPSIMQLELGTLGSDFAPYNPVFIRVNGRMKGLWRDLPGRVSYARIPIEPGDVHIGYNIITLETRWARTPRSMNVANDHRTVSIMYRGLALVPREALTVASAAGH